MSETIKKKTKDLEPGDIVVFADMLEKVTGVDNNGESIITVYVTRNGVSTYFYAGCDSVQEVKAK